MFVVEQEEYVKEGIDWVMVDFGMDLAAAIIMFEKPMGIWAILEEESLFPKATDKSFEEKLKASLGKLPVFLKPQSKTDARAHFAISHYAGIVSYNVTGWLEKNKDPVNDTVVEVLKSTSNIELLVHLWRDHPGQPTTTPKEEGKKKKKAGGGKTVSSVYLVSLVELMTTLYSCEPHFVRCLVPNTHKKPGEVEPPLIMHQLTCNGVLEGIRICMRGFPNRMLYPDFKLRYACLGQAAIKSSEDNKTAVYALMDGIPFDRERYRLGHTLVFFRAGSLGGLEEERDKLVIKWVRMIQGEAFKRIRGYVYKKKYDQRELIKVGQRNFRKYLASRDWGWFVLIQKTRGLIGRPNPEEELRLLEEKASETWGKYKEALDVTSNLQGSMDGLKAEIEAMGKQLAEEQGNISVYTDRQTKATATKVQAQAVLSSEESSRVALAAEVKSHSGSVGVVKKEIEDIELAIAKVELEKGNRDHTIKVLQDEIADQDEVIRKLNTSLQLSPSWNPPWVSLREAWTRRRRPVRPLRSRRGSSRATLRWLRMEWLSWSVPRGTSRSPSATRRRTTHSLLPSLTMSRTWSPRPRRESRRFRAASRPWRKNSRPSVRLVPRPRGRGPTWPGRSTSWVSVWMRPVVPPLPKWSSTRSARPR